MSYDIYLEIDTGGEDLATVYEIGNYTSNVRGMWAQALGCSLGDLHGRSAADAIPDLDRALAAMDADPETYREMNPDNGWGDFDGARGYLQRLRDGCTAHPKTQIYISR